MEEGQSLRHKLKNAEQEQLALKGLIMRAADKIDELVEADCSEEAISSAKALAKRLRRASKPDKDQ